ncbi:uncharacterized mitochondrial protein-like protein [Tanacetum coccineum]
MAILESCPKHNMVAYLEKTDGNAEFHKIIDFLARRSIHNALTVSLVVSTTFVEQFWMSAKSKIINNVRYITAKVAGKHVSISEASIRSDLLFDDADGIYSLPNQAIFDAIQLMGSKSTYLDQIPTNIATAVICLISNQKYNFSKLIFDGKITPLFSSMLIQPTEDEGAQSERPYEPQPTPSPTHLTKVHVKPQSDPSPRPSPTTHIPDSILEDSGGNHRGQSSSDRSLSGNEGGMTLQSVYDLCISLCTQVTDQAKEIKHLKAQIKKLKKKAKLVITHHKAWMKSASLKHRLAGKKSLNKQWIQKESVSKQGRKSAKAEPIVYKDQAFDELADDTLDYMDKESAHDVGRTRNVVSGEKETIDNRVSTEDVVSTDKEEVSTDKVKVSTDRSRVSTDKKELSTDRTDEGTDAQIVGRNGTQTTPTTPTPSIFGDDETIAQVLLNMSQAKTVLREKEKGVELKDVENIERPRHTSTRSLLTLKPLPKIDPKDKGKKKIEAKIPALEEIYDNPTDGIFTNSSYDDEGAVANFTNLEPVVNVILKSRFLNEFYGRTHFFLGLQVKQKEDGIFISQDKYVAEILKKFDFASVKTASTPIETQKPLVKDEDSHLQIAKASDDIACSRLQVNPKNSHLSSVRESFSDYAGANIDRKSTTGGCQFLGRRLISWQCKKQTIVATSTPEAEYVAADICCGKMVISSHA